MNSPRHWIACSPKSLRSTCENCAIGPASVFSSRRRMQISWKISLPICIFNVRWGNRPAAPKARPETLPLKKKNHQFRIGTLDQRGDQSRLAVLRSVALSLPFARLRQIRNPPLARTEPDWHLCFHFTSFVLEHAESIFRSFGKANRTESESTQSSTGHVIPRCHPPQLPRGWFGQPVHSAKL